MRPPSGPVLGWDRGHGRCWGFTLETGPRGRRAVEVWDEALDTPSKAVDVETGAESRVTVERAKP